MKRALILLLVCLLAFSFALAESPESPIDAEGDALLFSEAGDEAVSEIAAELAGAAEAVRSNDAAEAAPTVIAIKKSTSKKVWLGTAYQFKVTGKTVKSYKSSATKIATVDKKGVVTLKKTGTAKITATLTNKKQVVLTLKVADPLVPTGVAINEGATATIGLGETFRLTASVSPKTAPQDVKWTGNRDRVATIDASGLVTARDWGRVTFTAATANGKTADFTLIVKKPYTAPYMISHAMGGIDDTRYTNSLEAFQENYAEGHRIFEVDFECTSDGGLVLCHDWKRNWSSTYKTGKKPTLKQFMGAKLYGKYTPMCIDDLLTLMAEHPDITVITDNKYTDTATIKKQFKTIVKRAKAMGLAEVLDRFVVEIYNKQMFTTVSAIYPFKAYLFTLYKMFDKAPTKAQLKNIALFCQKNGISMIGMHTYWWKASYMDILREYDIDAAVYSTNSAKEVKTFMKQGVTAVFTDFLPPLA